MKISSTVNFKSLEAIQYLELPDFVVLLGINGSGKTQLLQGIAQQETIRVFDDNDNELISKKYVDNQALAPKNALAVSWDDLKKVINKTFQGYKDHKSRILNFLGQPKNNSQRMALHPDLRDLEWDVIPIIASSAGKSLEELTHEDFLEFFPFNQGVSKEDVFYQNFSILFKTYQIKREENDLNQYRSQKYGNIAFMTDEEFLERYGEPPWDLVNKIIREANLDYSVNSPEGQHRDAQFQLKLINSLNGAEINFSDLSGGEKVLMSLAFSLYNSHFENEFPQVLLMDEPDAPLHPSMTKQFLRVIENVFVKGKGVKVIITTHSPSTVALAPEASLYQMNKETPRITKVTKDKALKILTEGVPSFSINYENRRQVFVESHYDVLYYEKIYELLSQYLNPEISLSFISSGESRTDKNSMPISNCGQVVNITNVLRQAGNKFVWGIIDWDKANTSSDFIKVLGNGKRYSIESYLFDPVLLAALLLREKIILREEIGLLPNQNYTDFKHLSETIIQALSDFVVNKIANKVNITEASKVSVTYINGKSIEVPVWYLHYHGHYLENIILDTFPQLNGIKRGKEDALKLEILNKILDDIPEFMPRDILDILLSVQEI